MVETPIRIIRAHYWHIVIRQLLECDKAALFISQCPRVQDLTAEVLQFSDVSSMKQFYSHRWVGAMGTLAHASSPHQPDLVKEFPPSRLIFGVNLPIPAENPASVKAFQAEWRWSYGGRSSITCT
jgi:hypothetical protein